MTYSGGNVAEVTLTWPVNVPPANVGVAVVLISCIVSKVQDTSPAKVCDAAPTVRDNEFPTFNAKALAPATAWFAAVA